MPGTDAVAILGGYFSASGTAYCTVPTVHSTGKDIENFIITMVFFVLIVVVLGLFFLVIVLVTLLQVVLWLAGVFLNIGVALADRAV